MIENNYLNTNILLNQYMNQMQKSVLGTSGNLYQIAESDVSTFFPNILSEVMLNAKGMSGLDSKKTKETKEENEESTSEKDISKKEQSKPVQRVVSNVVMGKFENIVQEKKNPYVTITYQKGR